MKNYLILIFIALAFSTCKKEEDPEPSPTGSTRSLSTYELNFEGDWILIRTDQYDASGTTWNTIDHPGSPAHPDSLYNGTDWVFCDTDPFWYHYNFTSSGCLTGGLQWHGWYGNLPSSTSNMCWSASTDTLNMSGSLYLVEYIDTDSLVIKQTIPGAGYRLFLEKH